jgi:hypothetical protein
LLAVRRNEIVIINEKDQKDGNRGGLDIAGNWTSARRQIARKESHFERSARVAAARPAGALSKTGVDADFFAIRRLCQRY